MKFYTKIFLLATFTAALFLHADCNKSHSKTTVTVTKYADTPVQTLSLVFAGDVMQHGPQIRAALVDSPSGIYNYFPCFEKIAPIASLADFCIANLELTLAGPPYSGYPQFSAPDALASDMKKAGIRHLVTANNHSCDRGKKGIVRTVQVLDSLGIPHTGTFANEADRAKNTPMILKKNGFTIAVLNYTYGTNGLPIPEPTIVNLLDSVAITADLAMAQAFNPDKIIAFVHWGEEYQLLPNKYQKLYAGFLLKSGVDYIIGSHPHVLQPMERMYDSILKKDQLVVYSLGNFVSNQRDRYKDGGAMFKIELQKKNNKVELKQAGYILTWVDITDKGGDREYIIYPVSQYENDSVNIDKPALEKMHIFRDDSRELFEKHNKNIPEYIYDPKTGSWQAK